MSPALTIKETPIYIDASMIKCFSDCREQFRRRYVENRVPVKPSIPYVFGTAVHMAVEAFWKGKDYRTAYDIGLAHLDSVDISALTVREQGKYNELINSLPDMLAVYYKEHDFDKDKVESVQCLEWEWYSLYGKVPEDFNNAVYLCGRIDRYMSDGRLFDLKTASEIGPNWKQQYKAEKLRDCGLSLYDWYLCGLLDSPKQIAMEVLIKPYKNKPPRLELIELNEIIQYRERFKKQLKDYVTDIVFYLRNNSEVRPWQMNFGPICNGKYGPCDYLQLCNYGDTQKNLAKYKPREEHLEIRKTNINAI